MTQSTKDQLTVHTRRYNRSAFADQIIKDAHPLVDLDNITIADYAPKNWPDYEKVDLPREQQERRRLVLKLAGFGHKVWYRLSTVGGRAKLYVDTRTETYKTM